MIQNVILEVKCEDIDWELTDCDCDFGYNRIKRKKLRKEQLPNNLTICLEDKISCFMEIDRQELEDLISDELSKNTNFLHNGFTIKSIKFSTKYPITPTEDNEIFDLKKNIETKLNLRNQFKSTASLKHLLQ
jgi:hypothetical protein